MNLEHIVVGVEPRGLADEAVRAAVAIRQAADARLDLVHAVAVESTIRQRADEKRLAAVIAVAENEARKACVQRLGEVVRDPLFPANDWLSVRAGKPSRVLIEWALDHDTDLMFLGRHEKRGIFDFGGTARQVLGLAPCPVWVQPGEFSEIDRILAPIDLSPASESTARFAWTLAKALDAELELLHCFAMPTFALAVPGELDDTTYVVDDLRSIDRREFDGLMEQFRSDGMEFEAAFEEGDPDAIILDKQESADLIVMGTHGRTGLTRALLGSHADHVIKKSDRPVVAVPQPARFAVPAKSSASAATHG